MPSPSLPSSLSLKATAFLLLLAPTLFGGKCKCKGEPDPPPDGDTDGQVQDIRSSLQVVSIDPDTTPPQVAMVANVYGAGFKSGASVDIGPASSPLVDVVDENTLSVSIPGLPAGHYDLVVTNTDGGTATLHQALLVQEASGVACNFIRVHFAFNEAGITSQSKAELDSKLSCLQAKAGKIRVEGHTDNRGTVDYNLSLGQRRADAITRYLTGQGVGRSRVRTMSYGEERPVTKGYSEDAWTMNRRADIHAD